MNHNFGGIAVLADTNNTRREAMKKLPVEVLGDAVSSCSNGEFIFAANKVEVHVFLQRGRLAWATDSSHPFEFARFLKQRCSIDDDAFREVLEECRRSRAPVGQTLVGWELATWNDVRDSLRRQLALALVTLTASSHGATMFLTRDQFAEYDDKLTFDLAELLAELESIASMPNQSGATPREGGETPLPPPSAARLSAVSGANAQQILQAIRGASWVMFDDDVSVETATVGPEPTVAKDIAKRTLNDGADFFALRLADGCLLGARVPQKHPERAGQSLWCMLAGDSTFRGAIATIASLGLLRVSPHDRRVAPEPIAWRHGNLDASWSSEVEQVFAYGGEVSAVALLSRKGELVAGIGRASLDVKTCAALAKRRAAVFAAQPAGDAGALSALGFRFRTMATGEASVWAFGAEIPDDGEAATLWVMVGREASQGVGWACLTALLRRCQRAPEART